MALPGPDQEACLARAIGRWLCGERLALPADWRIPCVWEVRLLTGQPMDDDIRDALRQARAFNERDTHMLTLERKRDLLVKLRGIEGNGGAEAEIAGIVGELLEHMPRGEHADQVDREIAMRSRIGSSRPLAGPKTTKD